MSWIDAVVIVGGTLSVVFALIGIGLRSGILVLEDGRIRFR